ncbi:MAG: M1 family aminopeptidase [Pyrinomonadaceae bacterium]
MRILTVILLATSFAFAQTAAKNPVATPTRRGSDMPAIELGVSQELARWRAARYSDVRYKLNLTLEKMSPVLKGTIEIRVNVGAGTLLSPRGERREMPPPIILDWRKIKGHEEKSKISNVVLNGSTLSVPPSLTVGLAQPDAEARTSVRAASGLTYEENSEHLIFRDGVVAGENVITLDFTSPILTSGSAITRYVDKEDGSEYIYSLFVPSDASTAFPVFDQPDLKARFTLKIQQPIDWRKELKQQIDWKFISNTAGKEWIENYNGQGGRTMFSSAEFAETKPISTYVFAFAAGPFERIGAGTLLSAPTQSVGKEVSPQATIEDKSVLAPSIYVRKSQAEKFKPHAAEVFRLNREAIKYFEQYFDYKFPWPKYDLVLIPEFPFGGMEHAGATFLRESSIIFPQEPTKNDHISRATLIFHETAHQWFGDTVTMRWFDDLWLKEGFATFMAYKAMERVMPETNAWKVFYERVKQAAYRTDSTRGTTAIYQPIANLSAAKSAYGAIVYNKAPAFLRQTEFYLGEDKFQVALRAFLKKHEYGNAGWEDLVREFEAATGKKLDKWANGWVRTRGGPIVRVRIEHFTNAPEQIRVEQYSSPFAGWQFQTQLLWRKVNGNEQTVTIESKEAGTVFLPELGESSFVFVFANYQDYGYGIFLLDEKSRDYVLKNIQNEKDPFLRSMMWGSLWDSVREGELDPKEYVELVVKVLMQKPAREQGRNRDVDSYALTDVRASASEDESTVQLLLSRVSVAMNYYISAPSTALADVRASASGGNASMNELADLQKPARSKGENEKLTDKSGGKPVFLTASGGDDLRTRVENMLIERMQNAPTLGQRITYYRAFLNIASSENARLVLKKMLRDSADVPAAVGVASGRPAEEWGAGRTPDSQREAGATALPLKTKDRFDIVTRLLILGDPDATKLLADLEKNETSDDAKRYAYAAKAGIATAENKAKYWKDFIENKEISESWIEAAFGPFNSIEHTELTLPYLQKALQELPNHKRTRKIFFVNGWLGAFIGGQRSEEALNIVNKFLVDNPNLDNDLKLKILENVDVIERAVRIRSKYPPK